MNTLKEQAFDALTAYLARKGHLPSVSRFRDLVPGLGRNEARRQLQTFRLAHPDAPPHPKDQISISVRASVPNRNEDGNGETLYRLEESGDAATLESAKGRVTTLDALLTRANVDREVWNVTRHVVSSWEGLSKDPDGNVTVTPLFQVKAHLEKRPEVVSLRQIRDDAIAAMTRYAPKNVSLLREKSAGKHVLVLSPADAHIGKGSWAGESGEDMDIPGAVDVVRRSVHALVTDAVDFGLSEIVLILGNDLLQTDRPFTTTSGTVVDTSGTYRQAFNAARDLMVELVDQLRAVAPVTVLCVPGNHDQLSTIHLGDILSAWFRNTPDVTVDASAMPRKYFHRGRVLLGFTHGNEERHDALPQIMALEMAAVWGNTVTREWITGHYHRKAAKQFMPLIEEGGVLVRTVSSLSRADAWHARKGYIAIPAAEAFLYDPEKGLKVQLHWKP